MIKSNLRTTLWTTLTCQMMMVKVKVLIRMNLITKKRHMLQLPTVSKNTRKLPRSAKRL